MTKQTLYRYVKGSDRKPVGKDFNYRISVLYNGNPDVIVYSGTKWNWYDVDGQHSKFPIKDKSWSEIEWLEPVSADSKNLEYDAEKYAHENCPSCNDRSVEEGCSCKRLEAAYLAGASCLERKNNTKTAVNNEIYENLINENAALKGEIANLRDSLPPRLEQRSG